MKYVILIVSLLISTAAFAICPLCTFAVGAGIGLTQYLGIDDIITGLWTGGLTVSMIVWTITWLSKKNIRFFGRKILVVVFYYALTIIPLYTQHIVGHPLNTLWGVDKIILGIIIGSIALSAGTIYYEYLKKRHGGHAYFPFQKVVMPIAPLIILSIMFYYITK
jgi:hypothetical protein